jgi:hypothetical protein
MKFISKKSTSKSGLQPITENDNYNSWTTINQYLLLGKTYSSDAGFSSEDGVTAVFPSSSEITFSSG